ncbi:hypothetical protein V6N12_042014 [Hibiscus sabdariffa]|uniref:Chalcone/stilbene synthase N-terminal domain-containing protein n=1 Tax=Hibiscus sabdariffa TaxID=183260 RepID=A0ABR2EDI9_9ROSI
MIYQQGCFAVETGLRLTKDLAENNDGARVLVVCPKSIEDYKPILLVSSFYKILARVLSQRLSLCINDVMENTRFAFIARGLTRLFWICEWKRMRFSPRWRRWIGVCLETASISVLLNGVPSSRFSISRGPLLPMLFNIVGRL